MIDSPSALATAEGVNGLLASASEDFAIEEREVTIRFPTVEARTSSRCSVGSGRS